MTTERIGTARVTVCTVPTDAPESDGTLKWDATTIVIVELTAGTATGLGYTYSSRAAAVIVEDLLLPAVREIDPLDTRRCWQAMNAAVRNIGDTGLCLMAIAAVDSALWDLKAKRLHLPLVKLLGMSRESVAAYGSGGFTSYSPQRLCEQLGGWKEEGFTMVKMKVGRDADADRERVAAARTAVGPEVGLFVDANGGYGRKQAREMADVFSREGVCWFEEPVHHLDLEGLSRLRQAAPPDMEVTAGEYGFELEYFRRMIGAGAVDVLQADATRCGVTGFLQVDTLCRAHHLELSSHCAPSLHAHLCCAAGSVRHMEYFHDHVRIEHLLFDGAAQARQGMIAPDLSRPGLGLSLNRDKVNQYKVKGWEK